ncbi:MAG: hypothetical protein ABWY35_11435 [Pseudorhodoplanes sp.]
MEHVVLMLLVIAGAFILARIFVGACTTIDHALTTRKERRK